MKCGQCAGGGGGGGRDGGRLAETVDSVVGPGLCLRRVIAKLGELKALKKPRVLFFLWYFGVDGM